VLRVERYVNGELETNMEHEDMVSCIQGETGFRFLLAHSAKITNTLLAEKVGYLSNTHMIEALTAGTMDIHDNVDNVTTLILDEMSHPEMKLVVGNKEEIIVSPDNLKRYRKQACKNINLSMSLVYF
jgi:hypothetical protein